MTFFNDFLNVFKRGSQQEGKGVKYGISPKTFAKYRIS